MSLTTQPLSGRGVVARLAPGSWPRGWRAAAGLTSVAAGAAILTGAFLPWVEIFAGLIPLSGMRGSNGHILAAAGAVITVAGLWHLVRGGRVSRWVAGLAGFAALGVSGYLLIQLTRSMRIFGSDAMVAARGGPGLWLIAAGSAAAFATLLFPSSSQATLRRDTRQPVLARAADRESAGLRRGLQIALGVVWLLDAALQYQPHMFTTAFPDAVLAPSAMGGPAFVSGPLLATVRLIAAHEAAANAVFATVQLALAAGLFFRATVRAALIGTIAWGLGVWWLGEGLGMVFSGTATPLTGAPGAAVLYALLAVLIWPTAPAPRAGAPSPQAAASVADGSPLGRWARLAWFVLWSSMAALTLLAPAGAASLTASGGTRATVVTIGFAAAFALAAAGVLVPAAARPALVVAIVAAGVIWAFGEDFGGLMSGSATDPNSGPLLALLALAFWPARAAVTRGGSSAVSPVTAETTEAAREAERA